VKGQSIRRSLHPAAPNNWGEPYCPGPPSSHLSWSAPASSVIPPRSHQGVLNFQGRPSSSDWNDCPPYIPSEWLSLSLSTLISLQTASVRFYQSVASSRAGAMNAIKEKCRPKHQVLVLKCYPRTTKGAVDVRPNSSELSYLLFYAISRRSKIQKVGNFLEKKTASDVWRLRIG
jgi:hypothetical protein